MPWPLALIVSIQAVVILAGFGIWYAIGVRNPPKEDECER